MLRRGQGRGCEISEDGGGQWNVRGAAQKRQTEHDVHHGEWAGIGAKSEDSRTVTHTGVHAKRHLGDSECACCGSDQEHGSSRDTCHPK